MTPDVVGIDALVHDHQTVLAKLKAVWFAVFANNAPAFYAVTPARRAELLALEESWRVREAMSLWTINSIRNRKPLPLLSPWGNSPCIRTGNPMPTLSARRRYGGVALREPVTTEELASFIAYWQAEGKSLSPLQWQQKLARSLQIGRASNGGLPKRGCEYGQRT